MFPARVFWDGIINLERLHCICSSSVALGRETLTGPTSTFCPYNSHIILTTLFLVDYTLMLTIFVGFCS